MVRWLFGIREVWMAVVRKATRFFGRSAMRVALKAIGRPKDARRCIEFVNPCSAVVGRGADRD